MKFAKLISSFLIKFCNSIWKTSFVYQKKFPKLISRFLVKFSKTFRKTSYISKEICFVGPVYLINFHKTNFPKLKLYPKPYSTNFSKNCKFLHSQPTPLTYLAIHIARLHPTEIAHRGAEL